MDESYLTGEPYRISKAPGSTVLSGAINGDDGTDDPRRQAGRRFALRQDHAGDARLGAAAGRAAAARRPTRRLVHAAGRADRAGRVVVSGEPRRFLAVLVVATPCPLLIAIPVAIIGAMSLAARRGIIIKNPAVLEKLDRCRTAIFDKTGTLTFGAPSLTAAAAAPGRNGREVLGLVASLERYSKHPLAGAILAAAGAESDGGRRRRRERAARSGTGRHGLPAIACRSRVATNCWRTDRSWTGAAAAAAGLECVVLVDDRYAATLRFRDQPRPEGQPFIRHLGRKHG